MRRPGEPACCAIHQAPATAHPPVATGQFAARSGDARTGGVCSLAPKADALLIRPTAVPPCGGWPHRASRLRATIRAMSGVMCSMIPMCSAIGLIVGPLCTPASRTALPGRSRSPTGCGRSPTRPARAGSTGGPRPRHRTRDRGRHVLALLERRVTAAGLADRFIEKLGELHRLGAHDSWLALHHK